MCSSEGGTPRQEACSPSRAWAWRGLGRVLAVVLLTTGMAALDGCLGTLELPSTPQSLRASDGELSDAIILSWSAARRAEGYRVLRADSDSQAAARGTAFAPIATTPNTTYTDENVAPSRTYVYCVEAYNSSGTGRRSSTATGRTAASPVPPATPGGLAATDGRYTDRIVVSWSAVEEASSYDIQRAESPSGPFTTVERVTQTSWRDEGLGAEESYWYRVSSCNGEACSAPSETEGGSTASGSPVVPTEVRATDGAHPDKVVVSWVAVAGATSYNVFRSNSPEGTFALVATVTGSPWEDKGRRAGDHYWYKVVSCKNGQCSAYSTPDEGYAQQASVFPAQPTQVKASDDLDGKIRVSWAPVDGATSYEVRRSDSVGGVYSLRSSVTATSWDDEGLGSGVRFWYTVTACNSIGCSVPSLAEEGRTESASLTPPAGVSATDGAYIDKIVVFWSSVEGATSYIVHRAATQTGTYAIVATARGTSWSDTGLSPGAEYWYEVSACLGSVCGGPSNANAGSTAPPPPLPPAPGGVAASDGFCPGSITVSWRPVSGAAQYQVYRADSADGMYALRATVNVTSWEDAGLSLGAHYWYRVTACAAPGCSPLSASDAGSTGTATLTAPSSVAASDDEHSTQIDVSWTKVDGATSYEVYRGDLMAGPFTLVTTTERTSWSDTGLRPDRRYWYVVAACGCGACGPQSAAEEGKTRLAPDPPPAPVGVTASEGDYLDQIALWWRPVVGAATYDIYRADSPRGQHVYRGSSDNASWVDTGLAAGVYYWYSVAACNGEACSARSSVCEGFTGSAVPPTPTGIAASDGAKSDAIEVTWGATRGATSYKVYTSTEARGTYTLATEVGEPEWTDAPLPPSTHRWYRVTACSPSGCSTPSGENEGHTSAAPLSAPTGVSASDGSHPDRIDVSWNAVDGASSYEIYRAGSGAGPFVLEASTPSSPWVDAGESPGIHYWYKVTACNGSVCSAQSAPDEGSTALGGGSV